MSASAERTALKRALGSARRLFAVVGVFSSFINVLMLVTPLYMLQIYDRVLTSRSEDTLLAITGLAVGLIAVSAFLELVRARILVRLGARFDADLNPPSSPPSSTGSCAAGWPTAASSCATWTACGASSPGPG
jgi:ATP-binding cassette, subfamily C, bacterial EexD